MKEFYCRSCRVYHKNLVAVRAGRSFTCTEGAKKRSAAIKRALSSRARRESIPLDSELARHGEQIRQDYLLNYHSPESRTEFSRWYLGH